MLKSKLLVGVIIATTCLLNGFVNAAEKNYYEQLGYGVDNYNTPNTTFSPLPNESCAIIDSNYQGSGAYRLHGLLKPNHFKCQLFAFGIPIGSLYVVKPFCVSDGDIVENSFRLDSNGLCFCPDNTFFDEDTEQCKTEPTCPSGTVATVKNGKWFCEDEDKDDDSCTAKTAGTNPINIAIGNKFQTFIDYTQAGNNHFPLTVQRTYNSRNAANKIDRKSWQFFDAIASNWPLTTISEAKLVYANGKKITFVPDGNNGWLNDKDIFGKLESFVTVQGTDKILTGWKYTENNGTVKTFNKDGQITQITHPHGISHTYSYTNTTITVIHSNGQSLVYSLDNGKRVTSVKLPNNQTIRYEYDSAYSYNSKNNLVKVILDDNKTQQYHYEDTRFPSALTGLTDERGVRYATWSYDDKGRAKSSEHAGGKDKVTIGYTHLNDLTSPRVVVTNPLNKVTTYYHKLLNGVRKITKVEGHASDNCQAANQYKSYYDNGLVQTKTDWEGNVTYYEYDSRGRQTLSRSGLTWAGEPQYGVNVDTSVLQTTSSTRETKSCWQADGVNKTRVIEADSITDFIYTPKGAIQSKTTRTKAAANSVCP